MLDTVVLLLDKSMFNISKPELFDPPADAILSGKYMPGRSQRAIQNPTKLDKQNKLYKPRLTLIRRPARGGCSIELKIELSVPKLLFGNNLDELCEDDFEAVLDILEQALLSMGVETHYKYLRKAKVSAVHFGKNICMLDHTTCTMVMEEICKVNLGTVLECSQTDFRNDGKVIRSRANNHEIVFYDKKADMQAAKRSEKRGMESDYYAQMDLFEWSKFPKRLEILRYEVRLCKRTKLCSFLKKLGLPATATFDTVFKKIVSLKVLLHFWDRIKAAVPPLALSNFPPHDIFEAIASEMGNPKPAKILQAVGHFLLNGTIGEKQSRALILKYCDDRTWQRLRKAMYKPKILTKMRYYAIDSADAQIRRFEPVKMSQLCEPEVSKPAAKKSLRKSTPRKKAVRRRTRRK